jgi:hypothetical protein
MEIPLNRGFLFGALAFAVAYTLEAEWTKLRNDVEKYDSMRAMSGDTTFVKEQVERITGLVGWLVSQQTPAVAGVTRGLMQSLREDVVRYAKLEGM